ncbi:MAG TPA: hypothetical protein VNJ01_17795 [Bacteriovoracaceae bacterium]|nr:hypothetical protein [Bacteriovoracaceae bacterium]
MKKLLVLFTLMILSSTFALATSSYDKSYVCDSVDLHPDLQDSRDTETGSFKIEIIYPEEINKDGRADVIYTSSRGVHTVSLERVKVKKHRMAGMTFAKKYQPTGRIQGASWNVIQTGDTAMLFISSTGERYDIFKCSIVN